MSNRIPRLVAILVLLCSTALSLSAPPSNFLQTYRGTPYGDSRHPAAPQAIPGKIECAFYDAGGEGVAYHDMEAANKGSGMLNPADGSYLNEFRMREGVDTSYTKFDQKTVIDGSPYNVVAPPPNQLYVGWTEPGEWFRITVNATQAGDYAGDLLYTSNRGGSIAIDVNGEASSTPLAIKSTFDEDDPVAWRQWHHWNVAKDLVHLHLPAGKSVLTIHIVSGGQMNLATLAFHKAT